ncbi:four helix bundle protein [Neptuniibacter sp.]|uniref:four helix bundle protein n=1 Tax=Neptuniibacter sp. TaxID=1962643 RepID=UPI002615D113|nr:four helix bundle protein [Neptuniibacter sp.]MCP4597519.1 four helix bundle protein [Neptuniibacter sp.]
MSYESLDVWKRSCRLSCELYMQLSNCRDYGFKDQITRSGLSIPSNIAEGFERGSQKEKRQFLLYARGSAAELKTQIQIGSRVGFISSKIAPVWLKEATEIQQMLGGLLNSIDKSAR